jgi:sterol desaturase/sphingolipid hydroxylase (fatty acid hydroxylase superfamily)
METFDWLLPYKGLVVLAALSGFLLLDRVFPAAKVVGGIARVAKNLSFAVVNALLSWAIVVPLSAFAASQALGWRPTWWSGLPGLALDVVVLDCWIYVWHRANHEIPLFWRFHEIHHLDRFLDASTALRFHFGEVLLSSIVRAVAIFLLGVPLASVVVFETLLAVATIFHHSNVKLPRWLERPLSYVIVTPSIHWVHHHAIQRDTDSNYATVLSLWDRLFGSRSATARTPDMAIGVEGRSERGFSDLIKRPFEDNSSR